ncbi:MAG: hypothetical protein AAF899_13555 [Pseudomonadota bacterium]
MGAIYLARIANPAEVIERLAADSEAATDEERCRLHRSPGIGPVTSAAMPRMTLARTRSIRT